MSGKNVLLLAHDGEDFYKARLPFARFLKERGYEVSVILPQDKFTDLVSQEGFYVQHTSLERNSANPLSLLRSMREVNSFAAEHDISIVHSFKFFPNFINSFANLFSKRKVVLHIAGLGIAFANGGIKYRILKFLQQVIFLLEFMRANLVIVQNPDDYEDFLFKKSFRKKIKVVKGSGVDITKFSPLSESQARTPDSEKAVFLCTTRLIWEKGIKEMIEAFESLPSSTMEKVELRIIGAPDTKNPRGITTDYIERYKTSELIKFLGRQDNIKEHLHNSHVFILPSYYREGIPRSILEALASGLPVITTDVPGCKLTIVPNENGILIPPRSTQAIKAAVEKIMNEREKWIYMGAASRRLAVTNFSENVIFEEILNLYHT